MDRDAAMAMGMTDATPFLENDDSHWAAISGWIEDLGDLGDAEEFEDGDEALSDDDGSDDDEHRSLTRGAGSFFGCFFGLGKTHIG